MTWSTPVLNRRRILRVGVFVVVASLALPMASAGAANEAPMWVRTVQAPGTVDRATGVAADPVNGHVYTAGYGANHYGIIAYDETGTILWRDNPPRPAIGQGDLTPVVDPATGNLYVTGARYNTMAYSPSGQRLWESDYETTGVSGSAVVHDGVVTMTGYIYDPATFTSDSLTVAFSDDGALLWEQRFEGEERDSTGSWDIAVDEVTGSVFVTGPLDRPFGSPDGGDYLTVAYSRSGEQLWQALHSGPADIRGDLAKAIEVDSTRGRVYVTGDLFIDDQSPTVTVAYDLAGHQIWGRIYPGPYGPGSIITRDMVVDDTTGNVFVFTDVYGDETGADVALVVYDSAGTQIGEGTFVGRGTSADDVNRATIDPVHGIAYVAIESYAPEPPAGEDVFVLGYDASGTEVFRGRYQTAGRERSVDPEGIAVDPGSQQVYVAVHKRNGPRAPGVEHEATTIAFAAD